MNSFGTGVIQGLAKVIAGAIFGVILVIGFLAVDIVQRGW